MIKSDGDTAIIVSNNNARTSEETPASSLFIEIDRPPLLSDPLPEPVAVSAAALSSVLILSVSMEAA